MGYGRAPVGGSPRNRQATQRVVNRPASRNNQALAYQLLQSQPSSESVRILKQFLIVER